jgi:FkbM family methyltransferase
LFFKELYKIYGIVSRHPLAGRQKVKAFGRFLKWQIGQRLLPYPMVYNFVGDIKLILVKGQTSATAQYYMGLSEFEEMSFVLHFLKKDDLFVDVGANVGCFTLLASGIKNAHSIAIEPLPKTFNHLHNNLIINDLYKNIEALNIGLGDKKGVLKFTQNVSQNNHVANENDTNTISVEVNTLDEILKNKHPILLKIDVEGFEKAVIDGAIETLKKESLQVIIIELVGLGTRYGFDESDIQDILEVHGFVKYDYNPFTRDLKETKIMGCHNTIYIKNINFTRQRVREAPTFTILQQKI